MRGYYLTIILTISTLSLYGCSTLGHPSSLTRPSHYSHSFNRNLIFNPDTSNQASAIALRSDWPSAFAYDHPEEQITYQETIYDYQGRSGFHGHSDDQDYYRRFTSVRRGRTVR